MSNYYLVNVKNAKAIRAEHKHSLTEKHMIFDAKSQEFIKLNEYSFLCEDLEQEWFNHNTYMGENGVLLHFKPNCDTRSIFVCMGDGTKVEAIRLTKKQAIALANNKECVNDNFYLKAMKRRGSETIKP